MNYKIELMMKNSQLNMLVLFVTRLGFHAWSDDDKMSI